jgi:3-hydroxymyristoyl/3-hydroxydecanoyl-(acyl carrier protein) dehydratase
MDAHFRAFSFVDRITSVQDGKRIRGRYTIPSTATEFPLALVGEAVGQLAAWAAMAAVNFELRPVAGLAGSVELHREPVVGQVLALAADLEEVDNESVQYNGTAHLGEQLVIRLQDCVGPMVPLADFDDPKLLRGRFELLCNTGAVPGDFLGLPQLSLERISGNPGQAIAATFQVPTDAPLFGDHFPRRPVFPGSLLMHLNIQLGADLASEITPPGTGRWVPATMVDMKLRSFIPPGAVLRFEATLKQRSEDSAKLMLKTSMGNEVVGSGGLLLKTMEVA